LVGNQCFFQLFLWEWLLFEGVPQLVDVGTVDADELVEFFAGDAEFVGPEGDVGGELGGNFGGGVGAFVVLLVLGVGLAGFGGFGFFVLVGLGVVGVRNGAASFFGAL
jgi:hypothetical protein